MEKGMKPCCAAGAAAQVRYIMMNGDRIGISNLDGILRSAEAAAPDGEQAVRKELLRLVKIYNYVPSAVDKDYEEALYSEYLKSTANRSSNGPTPAERSPEQVKAVRDDIEAKEVSPIKDIGSKKD